MKLFSRKKMLKFQRHPNDPNKDIIIDPTKDGTELNLLHNKWEAWTEQEAVWEEGTFYPHSASCLILMASATNKLNDRTYLQNLAKMVFSNCRG